MSAKFLPLFFVVWALFAADPKGVFPFAYTQEDLPNGLRLVTIPTDSPNLVSVFIVVQTGSRDEVEPGKTGFAHLFEHLIIARIGAEQAVKGITLPLADLIIGACALELGYAIATVNVRDFNRIPGLNIIRL
jgi:hypothetical protein